MTFFHARHRLTTARQPRANSARVLLIRHADTDAASTWLAGRTAGVCLNVRGRTQLAALATRVAAERVTAVYSSPLERALDTAHAIASACAISDVRIENDLIEIDFGEWTGLSFAALNARNDWRRYNASRGSAVVPAGESPAGAQARIVSALQRIARQHDGVAAVVSHAEPIRYALLHASGRSLDCWHELEIAPASVHEFEEPRR